jgi:hypothetical protein
MFDRPRHRAVLAVLEGFEAERLSACGFLFAGGTRIVLDLGEFRESLDIDFLCSDPSGYGDLRFAARQRGYGALFTREGRERLGFPREIRTDQYGIRFPVEIGETRSKVDLVREARIDLESGTKPSWSPVICLSRPDCYAEKILASSDRWADRQVLSRDLVDLGMMRRRWGAIPEAAWCKVDRAYKGAGRQDLRKALAAFAEDEGHRGRCFRGLGVTEPGEVLAGLELLRGEV